MRNLVFPFALACLANLAFVDEPELPHVEKFYTTATTLKMDRLLTWHPASMTLTRIFAGLLSLALLGLLGWCLVRGVGDVRTQ